MPVPAPVLALKKPVEYEHYFMEYDYEHDSN